MFHRCMRIFHAPNAYIVTVHLTTHMQGRLVTENQLLSKAHLPLASTGNPRRSVNEDCDPGDSAPATAAAGILSREDICAECTKHLTEASAVPGSRDVLTSEGS